MAKYLDKSGLTYLWQKIKGAFAPISHTHTKSQISDFGGPYIATSDRGAANGVAPLGSDSKVPSTYLPSYVDDVVELIAIATSAPSTCAKDDMYFNSTSSKIFTATAANTWGDTGADPEKGKIYVNTSNNTSYRWSGSQMTEISSSLSIGTSAGTAYDGAAGAAIAAAYIKSASKGSNKLTLTKQDNSTVEVGKSDLGLGNVTDNAQVKGLASGTTNGHVVTWGSDGYTVADSGFTIGKSVPADAVFDATKDSALSYGTSSSDIDDAIATAEQSE